MKVVVADFRVTGNEHLVINSAIIEGLQGNDVASIDFFAERGHLNALTSNFPRIMKAAKQHSFPLHHHANRLVTLFFREILLPIKLMWVIVQARQSDLLLITTITPFGHVVLNLASTLRLIRMPCVVIMHSELEVMEGKKSFSQKAMQMWRRTVGRRVKYVVLSPHIERNIASDLSSRTHISSIFHPFTTDLIDLKSESRSARLQGRKIRIGVPGFIRNDKKGISNIFNLEKRLSEAGRQDIELYLIGRAARGFAPPDETKVRMPFLERTTPVPQAEFDQALSEMDVVLLMYNKESYRFTASGAVLDAMKFRQPLYASSNPLFDYMASEGIFPGYLADTIDDLFSEIVERVTVEYLQNDGLKFQRSLDALIERTDPERNASELLKI